MNIALEILSAVIQRNVEKSQSSVRASTQRIASGLRLNSAKDDTAGFAASNLMRARISSMAAAIGNCDQGRDLVQVASGALDVIDSQLRRLQELAVRAANGSIGQAERQMLQGELSKIVSEIERTSKGTEYGNIKLLDGTCNLDIQAGTQAGDSINIAFEKATATSLGETVTGVRGVQTVRTDGDLVGRIRTGSSYSDVIAGIIPDQVLTIRNAADERTVDISGASGNLDGVIDAINDLIADGMDGLRQVYANTAVSIPMDKSWFNGSEGDTVRFDLNIGGNSHAVEFQIGRNELETEQKYQTSLNEAILAVSGGATVLSWNTLVSSDAKSIGIGNLQYDDNAGVRIGSFSNTPQGEQLSFILTPPGGSDGTISFPKGATGAEDMDNLHDALSGLVPALDSYGYAFRKETSDSTIVITRQGGAAFEIGGLANGSTEAATAVVKSLENSTELNGATADITLEEGGLDSVTATAVNRDPRDLLFTGYQSGNAASIHEDAGDWAVIGPTAVIEFDPNLDFRISSNIDGVGGGGLFYAGANGDAAVHHDTRIVSSPTFVPISQIDLTTQEGARTAIAILNEAMATVNAVSGKAGASHNVLEHALDNLTKMSENLTTSESAIRDADYAAEITDLVKSQILSQTGMAMLAQAGEIFSKNLSQLLGNVE